MCKWVDEARPIRLGLLIPLGLLGVMAYDFLTIEGLQQRLTWVGDFGATLNPVYRALAVVLPDYMTPVTATWATHGVWVAFAVAMGWLGWRSRSLPEATPRGVDVNNEDQERVLT
jgi:hypothetical protein